MIIVPFKATHIETMKRSDSLGMRYLELPDARCLEGKLSFTGMVGDVAVMCAGALEVWPGRYIAWAYVSPDACHYWKSLHKAVKRFLSDLNAQRIEAEVDSDFEAGRRWIERLGFRCEAPRMARFFPDGRDASLYAITKD